MIIQLDEGDFGGNPDPSSLPIKDGKPVPPGEEVKTCGLCFWCRLKENDDHTPYAACTVKVPPGAGAPLVYIYPTDPKGLGCDEWKSAAPEFPDYFEMLRIWKWEKRCEADPDVQREEAKAWRAEQESYEQIEKERGTWYKKRPKELGPKVGG